MKPFNLERAKAGDPVVTRDGKPARIICFDRKCDCPIVALIEADDGISQEDIRSYNLNGEYHDIPTSKLNLFMAPKKHTRWINIYDADNEEGTRAHNTFDTKEKAMDVGKNYKGYITTIPVKWEEKGGEK